MQLTKRVVHGKTDPGLPMTRSQPLSRVAICTICLSAAITVASYPVQADQIFLKNGDRITGKVKSLDGVKLEVVTPYASTILIKWNDIDQLKMNKKMVVRLQNGKEIQGKLALGEPDHEIKVNNKPVPGLELRSQIKQMYSPTERFFGNGWSGSTAVSGKLENNSTENKSYGLDLSLTHNAGLIRNRGEFQLDQEKNNDIWTKKQLQFDYNFDRLLTQKLYFNTNYQYQSNEYKSLQRQHVLGVGLGYRFFDNPFQTFSIESGIAYTDQSFDNGEDKQSPALQWKLDYQRQSPLDWLSFFHNQQILLPRLDTKLAYYDFKTGFRVNLPGSIYLQLSHEWEYNNSPDSGGDRKDSIIKLGAGYNW